MSVNDSTKAKAALKRIRRSIAAILYVTLATGLVWLAATRWNGVPADPSGASLPVGSLPPRPIDPKWDRTKELVAALAALPPLPKLVLPPPPPNMRWNSAGGLIEPNDLLYGEWTPDSRPNLQAVVVHLNTPAARRAMEKLAAINPGGCRGGGVIRRTMFHAAKMFVGRARFRHAGRGDIDGALDDLATVYRLASIVSNSGDADHIAIAFGFGARADAELRQMAHEHTFTRSQAARVLKITRTVMPDKRELWRRVTASHCDPLDHLLALSYTDDGHGNGWLVLSRMRNINQAAWSPEARNGAWNVLSPFFNDRRTVAAKLCRFRKAVGQVGELPYLEARRAAEAIETRALSFTIVDGPLGYAGVGLYIPMLHRFTLQQIARRNANIAAAAFSAYRNDHGEYPDSLEALLGDYLTDLPLDPYIGQPLRYLQQQDGTDYVLYAVGPNQRDDGGIAPTKRMGIRPSERDGDVIFGHVRREPYWEPKLEVVNP